MSSTTPTSIIDAYYFFPKNPVLKKAINNQQLEEKINQIAYQRKLAENKLFGLNEEFAKQKLRERMS